MNYDEIDNMAERAIEWIYGTEFSFRNAHIKDDLMQEARIAIWQEMGKCNDKNIAATKFVHFLPKISYRAMIAYIRRRYHLEAEGGYRERQLTPDDDGAYQEISYRDDNLAEILLLHDIENIANTYRNTVKLTILLLYMGYGYKDISDIRQLDKGNVWRSAQRFGRRLLSAWQ